MKISDLLIKDRIDLDLKATNKEELLREMAKLHDKTGVLEDYEGYVEALKAREEQCSTGLEDGIAIPHAKTEYVLKPAIAMGRSKDGIDYESMDGEKSNLFFMIAAPDGANNEHIEALAKLTQLLLDDEFKNALSKAETPDDVIEIINFKENEIGSGDVSESTVKVEDESSVENKGERPFIIAATACPTGIAHTYMAESALKKAAEELGIEIKVETNGADGRKHELTADDIKRAKGVILAIDRNIEVDRFDGKPLIKVGAKEGINKAKELITRILNGEASIFKAEKSSVSNKEEEKESDTKNIYKHLMSGVSYMLPLVISGGILIAFAFLADSLAGFGDAKANYGSSSYLAQLFMAIGGMAFSLFVPILGGFIAYSIADRAGLTAGLVAGAIASEGGSGFLGAMVGGFLAGYVVKMLIKALSGLPKSLNGLKMILLYPVLSVGITGILMILVLNPLVAVINFGLTNFLNNMQGSSAVLLGILLAGMMAVDMGGPVNKAAYVFGSGTLASTMAIGGSSSMAAVMAGGMVPPLAIALATQFFPNKFTLQEREAGVSNYIMGLSFITEGAIPYAAADPTRVIPANVIGSAVAGALTMLFNIKIRAPHGGVLVMLLSNNFLMYALAIAIGSVVGALLLGAFKKEVK